MGAGAIPFRAGEWANERGALDAIAGHWNWPASNLD